jgi:ankyrin repeat protein
LLNYKADPNICSEGGSPLYTASLDGHTEIVELLLNNKADPNICFKGVSPLYTASLQGHTEIVELLDFRTDNYCHLDIQIIFKTLYFAWIHCQNHMTTFMNNRKCIITNIERDQLIFTR